MKIIKKWAWEIDDSDQNSIFVIADVYAATTNIVSLFDKGANSIMVVNEENVHSIKRFYPGSPIIGESKYLPESIFISSNLPCDIEKVSVAKEDVMYMSHNGSKVIEQVYSYSPHEVLTASFINSIQIANYLNIKTDKAIVLVASGNADLKDSIAMEDMYCLQALEKKMLNSSYDDIPEREKAEKFIRENYNTKNINRDMEIVFDSKQIPILPFCKKTYTNILRIQQLAY